MNSKLEKNIRVALIGVGNARDHACLCKLRTDSFIREAYFYCLGEGNALINQLNPLFFEAEEAFSHAIFHRVDLIICLDPELLITGLLTTFSEGGIAVFGPELVPSQLEASKKLMKNVLLSANLPTPPAKFSSSLTETLAYIDQRPLCVLKSDVFLASAHLRTIVTKSKMHAQESARLQAREFERLALDYSVIIEEKVIGEELSLHLFWDGKNYLLMPPVKDYKQVEDGDKGPNTHGAAAIAHGMGYSQAFTQTIKKDILDPLLTTISSAGLSYRGIIYVGLMLTESGPTILEINVRPGNPEFIALLELIKSSLGELLWGCSQGRLMSSKVIIHENNIAGVVFAMASGYPESTSIKAYSITGLASVRSSQGVEVYGEGIKLEGGKYRTSGGRVIAITSSGKTLAEVRESIYSCLEQLNYSGKHYRNDLGFGINKNILEESTRSVELLS